MIDICQILLSYLALLGLASILRREVGGGDVLVLSGAEVPLPSRPPVVDDPAVVLLDVRHHLPLVVDVTRHCHLRNRPILWITINEFANSYSFTL